MKRKFQPGYRILPPDSGVSVDWSIVWHRGSFVLSAEDEWSCGEASEWTAVDHALDISAKLPLSSQTALSNLIPKVASGGRVTLALVWSSSSSKRRAVGVSREVSLTDLRGPNDLIFSFSVPPGTMRGTVNVTARLFSAHPGNASYAPYAGLILGDLGLTQTIVLDGRGGLVPTREEQAGAEAPLWRLEAPGNEEEALSLSLDSGVLAMVLNRDHRHFGELNQMGGEPTALYWEVFAGWVTLLLLHFRPRSPEDEERISEATRLAQADNIPNVASFYSEVRKWLPERNATDAGEIAVAVRKQIERRLAMRRASGGGGAA
jgi:hypothetical protein